MYDKFFSYYVPNNDNVLTREYVRLHRLLKSET